MARWKWIEKAWNIEINKQEAVYKQDDWDWRSGRRRIAQAVEIIKE
jgi:hypothetical protein